MKRDCYRKERRFGERVLTDRYLSDNREQGSHRNVNQKMPPIYL